MTENGTIKEREFIWFNLSELYLDTELQSYDFEQLANLIYESSHSYEEIREIDKKEVFPVLYLNLLNATGVWNGFDKEWLVASILKKKKNSNSLTRNYYNFMYFCIKGMFKEEWREVEIHLQELKKKG